ncbi:MAG TPA: Amuc_1100 family pilus-like protein [Verrucomicrobiae bacterium]|nr:Amuc_1100 family pilus-like protein [Verrucomicrobiae bacterium]
MGWIKRNLFFTIGGVIALAFLGAAIYYNLESWNHNRKAFASLQEAYGELQNYYNQKPTPSETNILTEQLEEKQLRDWIGQARAHFAPIAPIPNPPNGVVTTEAFAGSLRKTIHDMQLAAVDANVDLPADYSFSFAAERNLVTFSPNSLNELASHLGEVKAICDVMFDAKVNGIDNIQREVVSDNDSAGPQSDYLAEKTRTVDMATITPYAITFRCFSGDLGRVLSKLASSNHGFIVTGINVMPAGGEGGSGGGNQDGNNQPPPNGELQTVLDEQLLRVSLGIEVVKLTK